MSTLENACRCGALSLALCGAAAATDASDPAAAHALMTTVDGPSGARGHALTFVAPDRARSCFRDVDVRVDLTDGSVVSVDHARRTYWESSVETIAETFAGLAERAQGIPLVGDLADESAVVTVREFEMPVRCGAWRCRHYVVGIGSALRVEAWLTEAFPHSPAYVEVLKMGYVRVGPIAGHFFRAFDALKELPGFPIRVRSEAHIAMVNVTSDVALIGWQPDDVADDVFAIDEEYRRRRAPFMTR